MRKSKILYVSILFLILQLFVFIGVAIWIIPNQENVGSNENLNGLWEKYLGGQSVVFDNSRHLPTSTNLEVVNPSGYSASHKLVGQTQYESGGPIDPGSYIIKYTNGSNTYEVTFSIIHANSSTIPVCYINSNTAENQYTSVEEALIEAQNKDVVYIIPNTNPIIYSNCEIKSGVTLNIPYAEGATNSSKASVVSNGRKDRDGNDYNDLDATPNTLTLYSNVVMTNNGTLEIGGKLASGTNGGPGKRFGHTSTEYSVLYMMPNSQIISNSNIYCYGFIYESCGESGCKNDPYVNTACAGEKCHNNGSKLIMKSGTLYIPFVIVDWQDGNLAKASYSALESSNSSKSSTFNQFMLMNISCETEIRYNAYLKSWANLYFYSQDAFYNAEASLVSSIVDTENKTLITLSNGSYIKSKFDNVKEINKLDFYGDIDVDALKLSINAGLLGGTINIDTSKAYFPLSWRFNISFNNIDTQPKSTIDASGLLFKVLTGCEIRINENVEFIADEIITCTTFVEPNQGSNSGERNLAKEVYPKNLKPGLVVVNGRLNVIKYGGRVYSASKYSSLIITDTSSTTCSIKIQEPLRLKSATLSSSIEEWWYITEELSIPLNSTNNSKIVGSYAPTNKTFVYTHNSEEYYYWERTDSSTNCNITYSTTFGVKPQTKIFNKTSSSYILKSEDLPILSEYHYEFLGWYDVNGNLVQVGNVITDSITLTARWIPITYNIYYEIDTDVGIIPDVPNNNPRTFNINTLPTLLELIDTNYVMNGWFLNSDYSGTKLSKLTLDNLEYLNENVITLYTKWMEPVLKTYNVTLIVTDKSGNPTNTITINDLIAEKTGIAYLNPYDGYGLSYTANDINDNSIKKYLDNWYFADYSSGEPQFTYNDSFKCGLSDDGKIILDGDDGASFIIYVKELSKYTVTYGEDDKEHYVSTFTTRSLTDSDAAVYRWMDSSGNIHKGNTSLTLSGDITLTKKTFHKVSVSATDATVKVSTTGNCILTSTDGDPTSATGSLVNDAVIYVLDSTKITMEPKYNKNNNQSCSSDATDDKITGVTEIVVKCDDGCIVSGTLITLADGSKKKIEDITFDDYILVFNHETGQLDVTKMLFISHNAQEYDYYEILDLRFSDGSNLRIVQEHVLFDSTLNEYVVINKNNVNDYIGHKFYTTEFVNGNYITECITLDSYEIYIDNVKIYCPVTAFHMNCFANDLLIMPSMPNSVNGLFNIFELDDDMKYNVELKEVDIAMYGIFTYEEFNEYIGYEISYEAYLASPAIYLKVSVGKGLITQKEIIMIIEYLLSGSLIT